MIADLLLHFWSFVEFVKLPVLLGSFSRSFQPGIALGAENANVVEQLQPAVAEVDFVVTA